MPRSEIRAVGQAGRQQIADTVPSPKSIFHYLPHMIKIVEMVRSYVRNNKIIIRTEQVVVGKGKSLRGGRREGGDKP